MRKKGDFRKDIIVKQEILDKYIKKENLKIVVDDRPSVIMMWKSNGLNVIDVGNNKYFVEERKKYNYYTK